MAKLYFRYGAMGASKTSNALMVEYNYFERNQNAVIFKPSIDTRDGIDIVKSRVGLAKKAHLLAPDDDAFEKIGSMNENRKIDCVIIDEMSMVDILLMEGLLAAVRPGTRLILVGDADQLPSVGAGNVLRDILASETVHAVRLKEIFRQAAESLIVVNAHRINRGEYPTYNEKDKDFFFLERQRYKDIQDTVRELLTTRLPAS